MSGNVIQSPSSGEGNGVQFPLIAEATDLPLKFATVEFATNYVFPCVIATFTDGELAQTHTPETDPVIQEHFGTQSYNEGTFGSRLRELLEGDDITLRHQVDGLIRYSARILAQQVVSGLISLPPHQNVEIHTQRGLTTQDLLQTILLGQSYGRDITKPYIGFDHQTAALERTPSVVVDYGPGLQGRWHIEEQLADWRLGRSLYTYMPIGKGPFINEFLQQYWFARLGDNPQLLSEVLGSVYIGREDGIATATTEFISANQQHKGTSEFADVVVASGIHSAGLEEVGAGIRNAHAILQPEGALLIRAPKAGYNETPDSVPAETMVDMALQAGFDPSKAQFFDTITGGDTGPRIQSLAALFRK